MLTMVMAAALAAQPISAGPLAGRLEMPAGKAKAALLILPGSGPTDRDGNNPLGVRASSYRMLAEGLAAQGIATVRIDKRGLGGSAGAGDGNQVSLARYAADTAQWIAAARRATGARCIWLAGHSEGGLVALKSAPQAGVCGLILIAAPGRPLATILKEQLRANPANAPLIADADRAIDALAAGRKVDVAGIHPALAQLFNPAVQDFLIDLMAADPAAMLRAYRGPVLVVSGGRDLQVGAADAAALGAAREGVRTLTLPAMNHVLKNVVGDRAANLASYADPTLPLAPGLVDGIAAFIRSGSSQPR